MLDSERTYIVSLIKKHERAARKAQREFIRSRDNAVYMVYRLEDNAARVLENLLCEIGGEPSENT